MNARYRAWHRALHRGGPADTGMTLVETMIALSLFTVVLALTASLMILGQRQALGTSIRLDNSSQGRVGMEAMSKVLRTAVVPTQLLVEGEACVGCGTTMLTAADSTSITFYANINNDIAGAGGVGPSRVTYRVAQDPVRLWGNLIEDTQPPVPGALPGQYSFCTPGAAGCVVRTRVIARGLLWPTPAIFTYYDVADATLAAPLSSTDLGRVDSMDVGLMVRTSAAYQTPGTMIVQRVALPNSAVPPNPSPTP